MQKKKKPMKPHETKFCPVIDGVMYRRSALIWATGQQWVGYALLVISCEHPSYCSLSCLLGDNGCSVVNYDVLSSRLPEAVGLVKMRVGTFLCAPCISRSRPVPKDCWSHCNQPALLIHCGWTRGTVTGSW